MHAKFLELDVVEHVITYDNIYYVMFVVVTLPMPNFNNASSSTSRGGLTTYENVVEPLVYNVVDPLIVAEVAQPTESVEKIHVRRLVRQK